MNIPSGLRDSAHRLCLKLTNHCRYSLYRDYLNSGILEDRESSEFFRSNWLASLIRYSLESVPFYQRLGIDPGTVTEANVIEDVIPQLPIVEREEFVENREAFISDRIDPNLLTEVRSSGTTGIPLRTYGEPEMRERYRAAEWLRFSYAGWRPRDRTALIWGNPADLDEGTGLKDRFQTWISGRKIFNAFMTPESDMAKWVEALGHFKPDFYYTYASSANMFSRYILENGLSLPYSQGVFTTSEMLLPEYRRNIEQAFEAPAFDVYGSRECGAISGECIAGGQHILPTVFAETHRKNGVPYLVVTTSYGYAMPLIRYRNRDLGVVQGHACECGRPGPLLDLSWGRELNVIKTPIGGLINGSYFTYFFYGQESARIFKFVQRKESEIDMEIVPREGKGAELRALVGRVVERCRIEQGLKVNVAYVEHIPVSKSGKFLNIENRLEIPTEGASN